MKITAGSPLFLFWTMSNTISNHCFAFFHELAVVAVEQMSVLYDFLPCGSVKSNWPPLYFFQIVLASSKKAECRSYWGSIRSTCSSHRNHYFKMMASFVCVSFFLLMLRTPDDQSLLTYVHVERIASMLTFSQETWWSWIIVSS